MDSNILQGFAEWTSNVDMQHGHVTWTCSVDMQHRHVELACSIDMRITFNMNVQLGHAAWRHGTCSIDMNM
jgi:hypothetical protein